MIPPTTHPAWRQLITGERSHNFSKPSAGLMFFNLRNRYRSNANDLPVLIVEARKFFEKYEDILKADIATLF